MDYQLESRIITLVIQFSNEAEAVAAEIRGIIPRNEPERYLNLMRRYEELSRWINTLKVRRAELEVAA